MAIMNTTNTVDYNSLQLLEALPAAVYTCDLQGKITFFNQAAADLWGRRPEIGKDMLCGSWKIYNPDGTTLDLDKCPMAVTLKEGRIVKSAEIIIEKPDGIRVHVLPYPRPILDTEGKMVGALNMLVDLSEKHQRDQHLIHSQNSYKNLSERLEEKVTERTLNLQKSEDRYHKMVEEVEDYAILLLDPDGNVQNWNLGAQKIKGYTEKEIIGKNFSLFYLIEDREKKLPQTLINRAAREGKAMHEGWRLKKNGEKFWGFVVLTALHDDDGTIIGFSKVTRDLTERKLFEDQLKENALNIEFRNKQLEEYAHIASHDLQEPLRKIRIFAEMLSHKIKDEDALRDIRKIESSASRMTILIKDVLAYSEIAQGEQMFAPTDLNEVLSNVIEDCELWILEKNITIEQTSLPVINAIPIQMHQLFSNLITNALKYSNSGGTISILGDIIYAADASELKLKENTNYLQLIFRDNGVGFDAKYSDQVFKLFQRLNTSQHGTGIGLALCKKIIENHSGTITVKSEVGIGTEFLICLPLDYEGQ